MHCPNSGSIPENKRQKHSIQFSSSSVTQLLRVPLMLATDGQRVTSLVEEPPIEGKPYTFFLLITILILLLLLLLKDQPQKLERM